MERNTGTHGTLQKKHAHVTVAANLVAKWTLDIPAYIGGVKNASPKWQRTIDFVDRLEMQL